MVREIDFSRDPADFDYMEVNVPCQVACPAYTNIPAYIRTLYEGRYDRSYELNRIVNVLPGVLGRICSKPCEDKCRHGEAELGEPVTIPTAAAIANAVYHATGIRITQTPINPVQLCRLLADQKKEA